MGRGDMRTAKGKRTRGTYGNSRPKKSNGVKKTGPTAATATAKKPASAKPAPAATRKKS